MARKKKVIQLLERVTDESSTQNVSVAPIVNTNAMQLVDQIQEIPPVDGWVCPPEAELFKHVEKYIIITVSTYFGVDNPNDILNFFDVSPKRCYNRPEMRSHLTTYLNYLTYYFDKEDPETEEEEKEQSCSLGQSFVALSDSQSINWCLLEPGYAGEC